MPELVDAEPLRPFDVRTSDGRAYFADSPDSIARGRLHAHPGADELLREAESRAR